MPIVNKKLQKKQSFKDFFYEIVACFCDDIVKFQGDGILKQDIDNIVDFFESKYCNKDNIIILEDDKAAIVYGADLEVSFYDLDNFADFCKKYGNKKSKIKCKLSIPFKGWSQIFNFHQDKYIPGFKFEIDTSKLTNSIQVKFLYKFYDENEISTDMLEYIKSVIDFINVINSEYLSINQKFNQGIYNLDKYRNQKFNNAKSVLEYCFPYLVFTKYFSGLNSKA
ncbi:MAG: hypothetical protein LBT47_12350 [Deltaproteobacteria bacterium]|jgi:hypothetical protein|nr:hypothetical protein [Deltaproteobacteria bacterium]